MMPATESVVPPRIEPSRVVAARPHVLLVDDVEANLAVLSALLEDVDCELVLARSGAEALARLAEREFAVVLLDVHMPDLDGYEVANRARGQALNRDVPIIFVTAMSSNEESELRGYGSGAVDVLFKPIKPAILRGKVRVFLELHQGRQKLADAYAELQATQARLIQSAKMASLGELVAGVAHEINNPLAFSIGHLDTTVRSLSDIREEVVPVLSEMGLARWKRVEDRLREMGFGLDRIRQLVLKLRVFSRLDEGERKVVSVRECVDSVLTILGHRLNDRLRVVLRFDAPDRLDCFPGLLNQAVMNLVANAIDAIEGDGSITIATSTGGGAYVIAVSDTGHGIPDGIKERVLEPFFTTKPVGQGTGLGLSITYSIVKKHGGVLDIGTAPGGGTSVVIRLPMGTPE